MKKILSYLRNLSEYNFFKNLKFVIFSLFSVLGIYFVYNLDSNNFLFIILFFLYFFCYRNSKFNFNKKELVFCIFFSLFLSAILILGNQLELYSAISWKINTFINFMFLTFSIFPIICLILKFILNNKIIYSKKLNYKKLLIITFIIIFLANFLAWLALYPGVYGYDAGYQIMVILEKMQITSFFSVLYTCLLGKTVQFGMNLFNSYQIGLAIFTFFQMLFLTFVAFKIISYILKKTNNFLFSLVFILFYSLFPLHLVMTVSTAQDALFSGIFALLFLELLEIVENKNYWNYKRHYVFLVFLMFLLIVTRNNGIYCLIFIIPFLLIFNKRNIRKVLAISLTLFVFYFGYTNIFFDFANIEKVNNIQEMLSIPSQQLARVYVYNNAIFNEDDIEKLTSFYSNIENFNLYLYRPSISDPIKELVNNDFVKSNFASYLSFWGKIGLKDPKNYIEAFLLNSLGFWYPNKNYYDARMYHPYMEYNMLDVKLWNPKYIEISRSSKFPIYEHLLNSVVGENSWQKIPILSTVFSLGFYFIIFIFAFLIVIVRRKFSYLLPLSLAMGLYITLFLSPVALFRYGYPFVLISPLLITIIFTICQPKFME